MIKDVGVDLPVGLSVNPQATPQCPLATFLESAAKCAGSEVGESAITASLNGVPIPPAPPLTQVTVYNLVPAEGEPALFGFNAVGQNVFLKSDVDWSGDYHGGSRSRCPPRRSGRSSRTGSTSTGWPATAPS